MSAWAWDGGGGGGGAQPSPGDSPHKQLQQQQQQYQQHHHLLPVSSIGVPDSPLSEDTLSSLLGAFHLEAADPLRSIDPGNLVSVVSSPFSHADACSFFAGWLCHRWPPICPLPTLVPALPGCPSAPLPALLQVSALLEPSELSQFVAAVLIERRLELGSEADRGELVR